MKPCSFCSERLLQSCLLCFMCKTGPLAQEKSLNLLDSCSLTQDYALRECVNFFIFFMFSV